MREADGAECGNDGFPSRADAVCAVRVRGERDEPPAEGKVPLKHVRGGDKISRAARGRVDFQNLIARDDPAQNVVEEVRIVRIAHGAVGVGGIPRNVAEVRHNVVTVGRVQTLAYAQKIGAVGGLLRLADEVFRKPRVMPVHRMHAVHDEVGLVPRDHVRVHGVGACVRRVSELAADEKAGTMSAFGLQFARAGKVSRRVGHGYGFSLDEDAVGEIVVVEVFGNAVVGDAELFRAGEHIRERGDPVRGKRAVRVYVGKFHACIIARPRAECKHRNAVARRVRGSEDAPPRDEVFLPRGGHLFDDGVVARRVQDIIFAEVERNVSDAFHTRLVVPLRVGVEQEVSAPDILPRHGRTLFHLRAGGHVEQDPRALVEDILHERGAVERVRREVFQKIPLAVVQADRAVHIGNAQKFQPLVDDALDRVARLGQRCNGGVRRLCAHIGGLSAVARLVPVAVSARKVQHIAAVHLPERGVRRARTPAHVESVRIHQHILRVQTDGGNVRFGLGLFGRLLGNFGGFGLRFIVGERGLFGERLLGEFGKLRILIGQDDRRVVVRVIRISSARRQNGRNAQKECKGASSGCNRVFLHGKYLPCLISRVYSIRTDVPKARKSYR